MQPQAIEHALQAVLPQVQKPGRYTGGELNQVVKNWNETPIRVALAFPDIYDLGMSNLGLAILYDILNRQADALAERTFAPWPDMEASLRREGIPLFSLESKHPLSDFDILGFSLPYESLYTNVLNMLDLSRIPLRSTDRGPNDPLIIAGGHATFNPEPMADFIDVFAIGEGEEVVLDILTHVRQWRARGGQREDLLRDLSQVWGLYVPSLYRVQYREDGKVSQVEATSPAASMPVLKRLVPELPPPLTRFIVPFVDIAQNRIAMEIMRGCTRGCRFCHAGMVTRPVRERSVQEIAEAIDQALDLTGYDEVALLSLSSSDYTHISQLVRELAQRFGDQHLNISLPSLRIESFSVELMDLLEGKARRGGFTLAPEAATDKMRKTINKPVTSDQLLDTARSIYEHGWHTIKLYFMIGHPSETLDDVRAIADLSRAVLSQGRKAIGKRARVSVSVGTFVPKPHTPFQFVPCDSVERIEEKQALLKREIRGPGFKLNWTDPKQTLLEAWLSRGDRRLGRVILEAWRGGAKFDAWQEHFNFYAWAQAFEACALNPSFYTHRSRAVGETLPWDHIDAGIKKEYLIQEYLRSKRGETRQDCREGCFGCGILPKFSDLRRDHPGEAWCCPEVKPRKKQEAGERIPAASA